jgi:hypothetical protein
MPDLVLRNLHHCLMLLSLLALIKKMTLDTEERGAVAALLRSTADELEGLRVSNDREHVGVFIQ